MFANISYLCINESLLMHSMNRKKSVSNKVSKRYDTNKN